MNPWWTIFFSAGTSTVFVVIINAIVQRRHLGAETSKLGTEATKIITDAASGVVRDLESDNKRLRGELANERDQRIKLAIRVQNLERHDAKREREWTSWADHASKALVAAGASMALPIPESNAPSH